MLCNVFFKYIVRTFLKCKQKRQKQRTKNVKKGENKSKDVASRMLGRSCVVLSSGKAAQHLTISDAFGAPLIPPVSAAVHAQAFPRMASPIKV